MRVHPIKYTSRGLAGLLSMLLAVVLAACGGSAEAPNVPAAAPSATPVPLSGEAVIYVAAPLSGIHAQEGQAQAAGARLAAAMLNEQGGLNGQEIVIRVVNDRGTPDGAQQAADQIAAESGSGNVVGVIISESSDPQLQAAEAVYLNGGIASAPLVVVPASTSPLAADIDHPNFFRLTAPSASQAAEIAAALQESNIRDVVALHSPTASSRTLTDQFQQAAADLGITVSDSLEVNADDTDFLAIAEAILAANPAALFLATNPFESGQMLSRLYQIDYQGGIYAADQALPYAVVDELGCQAEGLFRASVVPSPETVMTAGMLGRYASSEGRTAEPFSVAGYAAVEFMAAAYSGAETEDATQAAAYARSTPVNTLLGELDFSADGERVGATMHFQQVQSRTFADAFQRTVGSEPTASQETTASDQPFLAGRTFPADRDPVVFADLNWNSALFHNAIARIIIEAGYDYPTRAVPGSTVPSFQRLTRGEVDIIMERYNFDETVAEAIDSGQIADLGVNFSGAVQGWFVPRYVVDPDNDRGIEPAAPDLQSVDQLEQFVSVFQATEQGGVGAFYGGVPGWTAHKINCLKLKAYRLDDNYAQVTSASTSDLFGSLAAAYDNGEPILLYLWAPTSVFGRYDLVQLEEPAYNDTCWSTDRGCAYPTGDVKVLVHGSLPDRAPEIAQFLTDLAMDIDQVSAVLVQMEDESLTPDEAARLWMQENDAVWSAWVPDEVAERVRSALNG